MAPWKSEKGTKVKRYEGLFILNPPAKEDGVKEVMDKLQKEIEKAGGKVETTQKMDKKSFVRVANKKHNAGFYVNFIFEAPESAIEAIRSHLRMDEEVFRMLFTVAPPAKEAAAATQ
jgi:ribosomal protein S6